MLLAGSSPRDVRIREELNCSLVEDRVQLKIPFLSVGTLGSSLFIGPN